MEITKIFLKEEDLIQIKILENLEIIIDLIKTKISKFCLLP